MEDTEWIYSPQSSNYAPKCNNTAGFKLYDFMPSFEMQEQEL